MRTVAASAYASSPLWYTTRSTAVIAFLLLTVSVGLGVGATQRAVASSGWPRFATQELHRNVSLLGLLFVVVHIVTTLADQYVHVGWLAAVVPGVSGYRTAWVALGTLAFDVFLVVIATSLVRDRLPLRLWRGLHWTVYAAWPLAFVHFLETGTDAAHHRWGLWFALVCLALVLVVVIARLLTRHQVTGPARSVRDLVQ